MKRGLLISLLLLAAILILVSAASVSILRFREPAYGGKPLSEWLASRFTTNTRAPLHPPSRASTEAIRRIGTNGIPTLLQMLQSHDSTLGLHLRQILGRLHVRTPQYRDAGYRIADALYGFSVLGSSASNAVPELIRIYERSSPIYTTRYCVVLALGAIGPPAEPAIPLLLQAVENEDNLLRAAALNALGRIGREPAVVVPVLTRLLNDPDFAVRHEAAEALGAFGNAALSAVPQLLATHKNADKSANSVVIRSSIELTLWKVSPSAIPNVIEVPLAAGPSSSNAWFLAVGKSIEPMLASDDLNSDFRQISLNSARDRIAVYHGPRIRGETVAEWEQEHANTNNPFGSWAVNFGSKRGTLYLWVRDREDYRAQTLHQIK